MSQCAKYATEYLRSLYDDVYDAYDAVADESAAAVDTSNQGRNS